MTNKISFSWILLLIATLSIAQKPKDIKTAAGQTAKKVFTYTNPITRDTAISMRDHFIIKVENKWYCIGTSNPVWTQLNPGVRMLVSDDLINWKQHSFIIDASELPADCPYNGRFWASEIHFISRNRT